MTTQQPDTAPGAYYISVRRDDGDTRLLSGPYNEHARALAMVDRAWREAERIDPKAVWYSFGTVRMREGYTAPGILQRLGFDLDINRGEA